MAVHSVGIEGIRTNGTRFLSLMDGNPRGGSPLMYRQEKPVCTTKWPACIPRRITRSCPSSTVLRDMVWSNPVWLDVRISWRYRFRKELSPIHSQTDRSLSIIYVHTYIQINEIIRLWTLDMIHIYFISLHMRCTYLLYVTYHCRYKLRLYTITTKLLINYFTPINRIDDIANQSRQTHYRILSTNFYNEKFYQTCFRGPLFNATKLFIRNKFFSKKKKKERNVLKMIRMYLASPIFSFPFFFFRLS